MMWYLLIVVVLTLFSAAVLRRKKQIVTHAGGIVYRQKGGQMLFLIVTSSTNKNKWVLPKGKIESGETPEATAVREVREEAGVIAKPVKQAGTVAYAKKGNRITVVYFLMEFEANNKGAMEDRKAEWLEKDEMLKRLTNIRVVELISNLQV